LQRVIVDAGPLIAWFNADDEFHLLARGYFEGYTGELLTTWPALGEVCAMLPVRFVAPFLRWVGMGGVTVIDVPASALTGLADRLDKYASLPMDLADATLVWLAELLGLLDIATVDRRDVGVYRTARGEALRNVLFDAPAPPSSRKRGARR